MLRLGIVDFDSSHSLEFTRRFNHVGVDADQCVDGARVVVGCPGKSLMQPERIPGFTEQIEKCGVELVSDPAEMIGKIDAILVLSICGKAHLDRVRPFFEAGLPAYVDKPFACSLEDAEEIVRLSNEHSVPVFGSSALRYCEEVKAFQSRQTVLGAVNGIISYGPAKRAEGNPGLFHYGIHPAEILLTVMGPGCEWVETTYTEAAELVTAGWPDGRIATLRGNRAGSKAYGFLAFCENAVIDQRLSARYAYRNLCQEMVKTFETGQPALPNEVTLEVVRFVLASLKSEENTGERVRLDSL